MTALLYDRPPFVLEIAEITYPGEKMPLAFATRMVSSTQVTSPINMPEDE